MHVLLDEQLPVALAAEATVQIGRTIQRMRARVAQGDEREHLWADFVQRYSDYGKY